MRWRDHRRSAPQAASRDGSIGGADASEQPQIGQLPTHRFGHHRKVPRSAAEIWPRHREEFHLLEWYRSPGELPDVMADVERVVDRLFAVAHAVRARLATDDDVEMISQSAQAAANAGVSGVPTFILGGKYAVSGAQPSDQLASAIREVAALGKEAAQ